MAERWTILALAAWGLVLYLFLAGEWLLAAAALATVILTAIFFPGLTADRPPTAVGLTIRLWRLRLFIALLAGRLVRFVIDSRGPLALIALCAAPLLAIKGLTVEAFVVVSAWLAVGLAIAALTAVGRLIVGEFSDFSRSPNAPESASDASSGNGPESAGASTGINLGNLVIVELSRLNDLFRVVGDRRAVSSQLGHPRALQGADDGVPAMSLLVHRRALDSTLSVDALVDALQGTVSADTKATFGPFSIPVAPLVTLFGRLVQAPRLTGALHRDGPTLILTAQTSGRGSLSWRVQPSLPPQDRVATAVGSPNTVTGEPAVTRLVEELALRIHTDLALGRSVRWEATQAFVEGLQRFRSCLRTPKDRKVNLKEAEQQFLKALREDEDFPLVYYNLGVVYTELHGLAVAAGRTEESVAHLSAAEASFGRALQNEPTRWDCYFAFAQTQFRYRRFESVIDLCREMLELKPQPTLGDRAKTRELSARARIGRERADDYADAFQDAWQATRYALRTLFRARLLHRRSRRGEEGAETHSAALASGCLLTLSEIYSRRLPHAPARSPGSMRRWHQERIARRIRALGDLSPLADGRAELRFTFGWRALRSGYLELATEELSAAVRSDPTRPTYAAGLALAKAQAAPRDDDRELDPEARDEIVALCRRALQGLAGAFFPARDPSAARIVAEVYEHMASRAENDKRTANQLRRIAAEVDSRLANTAEGAAVSGTFLQVIQDLRKRRTVNMNRVKVGRYGIAAQQARRQLEEGRRLLDGPLSASPNRPLALKRFRDALNQAERATALNPLSTLAWETLGDVHREFSDFQNARTAWEQALGTDPDNPALYAKIGSSYAHFGDEGRAVAVRADLERAKDYFENALKLYGRRSFKEQVLTRYRLGKLYAQLRECELARGHLDIVEAVDDQPPLVGWVLLAFAYLEMRNFTESEDYFNRVIAEGAVVAKRPKATPGYIVGDRLDEVWWPLGLVRVWGYLGRAITDIGRDGSEIRAREDLGDATALIAELDAVSGAAPTTQRFRTRAPATVLECEGILALNENDVDVAIQKLREAVAQFPYSTYYVGLAIALIADARRTGVVADRLEVLDRAKRLLGHAVMLGPQPDPERPSRAVELQTELDHLITEAKTV